MKKKKGFTLLELIIVVALVSVVLAITFNIIINISKTNSEIKIKSTLQSEAQNISKIITDQGMQASGIVGVTLADGTVIDIGTNTEKNYSDPQLKFISSDNIVDKDNPENNKWISVKKIELKSKYEIIKDSKQSINDITWGIMDDSGKGTLQVDRVLLPDGSTTLRDVSSDIESVLIQPSNIFKFDDTNQLIKNTGGKMSDAAAIEIIVNLSKKTMGKDIKYSVPITITFRNKEVS